MKLPKGFVSAGVVTHPRLLADQPAFVKRKPTRGAKAVGVRYERKVAEYVKGLADRVPEGVALFGPWLEFHSDGQRRYCQPDIVLLDPAHRQGIVIEVKYRHCAEAWFQLWRLYVPVLEKLYPDTTWSCVEIVKWFDPETAWPEQTSFTETPLAIPRWPLTAIHIWNPQRA